MYARLNEVEEKLKTIHGDSFHIIRIKAKECHGKPIDNLTDYIRHAGVFPNQVMRFCTRLFKIAPYNAFLRNKTPCSLMVGLNADEIENRTGNHGLEGVTVEYPLADLGITREKCKQLLSAYDLLPNFPPYMSRGGCTYCPYKSRKTFAAMVHLAPDEMRELIALEKEINESPKNTRSNFWPVSFNVPEGFESFMENELSQSLFSAAEMYGLQQGIDSPCGVFCNR
jgi:3'-phosphoadenosine 5'-phosphosulfate sulfotransferase (PAPS reductase)/FAD synthetase